MTRGGLSRCLHRAAGPGAALALAAVVGVTGCSTGPDGPSAEALTRRELAAVVARHLPAASEPSRACLVDRLAADSVEPDRLERFLVDGGAAADDDRPGPDVAVELAVTTARAVCLTVEELLAAG